MANLFKAARIGPASKLPELVKEVGNVNVVAKGWCPIHSAALVGNAETMGTLIELGADVSVKIPDGSTALHLLGEQGSVTCAGMLLDAGIDPTLKSDLSQTALDIAVVYNHVELTELLLSHLERRGVPVDLDQLLQLTQKDCDAKDVATFLEKRIRDTQQAASGTSTSSNSTATFRVASSPTTSSSMRGAVSPPGTSPHTSLSKILTLMIFEGPNANGATFALVTATLVSALLLMRRLSARSSVAVAIGAVLTTALIIAFRLSAQRRSR